MREREHSTTDRALALDVRTLQHTIDLSGYDKVGLRWTRGESVTIAGVTVIGGEHAFIERYDHRARQGAHREPRHRVDLLQLRRGEAVVDVPALWPALRDRLRQRSMALRVPAMRVPDLRIGAGRRTHAGEMQEP